LHVSEPLHLQLHFKMLSLKNADSFLHAALKLAKIKLLLVIIKSFLIIYLRRSLIYDVAQKNDALTVN